MAKKNESVISQFVDPSTGRRIISRTVYVAVLKRDNHTCQYCGDLAQHLDHVIPASFGGREVESNLVASCAWCNQKLGNRYFEDGADGKRLFISEMLHLKSRWFRKQHTICGDCHEIFKPRVDGSTEVLCSTCAAMDVAEVNGSLVPMSSKERRAQLKLINEHTQRLA